MMNSTAIPARLLSAENSRVAPVPLPRAFRYMFLKKNCMLNIATAAVIIP